MAQTITGVIEKYHSAPGKQPGIKIQGVWYNATQRTRQYVEKLREGLQVSIDVEGKMISFVKNVAHPVNDDDDLPPDVPQPGSAPPRSLPPQVKEEEILGVTIGMAINNATLAVNARLEKIEPTEDMPTPEQWALAVVDHAEQLLKRMKERKLL